MWLCILLCKQFEDTFEKARWRKVKQIQPVWLYSIHPLEQDIWEHIWKSTVEKNRTNATNVNLHLIIQAIWRDIWKHTVGTNRTNAANATLHLFGQAIWKSIWKNTVDKSQTKITNVYLSYTSTTTSKNPSTTPSINPYKYKCLKYKYKFVKYKYK